MTRPVPTWKEKQSLLYDPQAKHDATKLTQIAESAMGADEIHEALEYFGYAKNDAGLERIEASAKEEGDFFLLVGIETFREKTFSKEIWNEVGQNALDKGKTKFAIQAFERAENEVMVAKLKGPELYGEKD